MFGSIFGVPYFGEIPVCFELLFVLFFSSSPFVRNAKVANASVNQWRVVRLLDFACTHQ